MKPTIPEANNFHNMQRAKPQCTERPKHTIRLFTRELATAFSITQIHNLCKCISDVRNCYNLMMWASKT